VLRERVRVRLHSRLGNIHSVLLCPSGYVSKPFKGDVLDESGVSDVASSVSILICVEN